MFGVREAVIPSSDLRNHYSEVSRQCREDGTAQIITVNGRGDTVLISFEEYSRIKARLELYSQLAESEEDVRNGRISSMDGTFDELRRMVREGTI